MSLEMPISQPETEKPLTVGERMNMASELAPAIDVNQVKKDKMKKMEGLANVMDLGKDAASPYGVLGSAMQGYAESGGTWGSMGDDLKHGLGKIKGMFGG